jgi:hypothetical protein
MNACNECYQLSPLDCAGHGVGLAHRIRVVCCGLSLFFSFSRTISRSLSRARALSLSRALSLNLALSLSRSLARALSAHASSLSSGVGHVLCTACAWCGVVWRVSLGIARRKQHMLAYTQAMKKAGLIRRVMYDALMYETLY